MATIKQTAEYLLSQLSRSPESEKLGIIVSVLEEYGAVVIKQICAFCAYCGKPATCLGAYDMETDAKYACDDCCGHGNEDGWCKPINHNQER